MKLEDLKPRLTVEELTKLFEEELPALIPTRISLGKFAKKLGYRWCKQNVNGKMLMFYVRIDCLTRVEDLNYEGDEK